MIALHVARDQVERVTSLDFASAEVATTTIPYTFTNGTMSGTYVVSSGGANLKDIRVRVPWFNTVTETQSVLEVETTMAAAVHF